MLTALVLLSCGCSGDGATPDGEAPRAEQSVDPTTALRERCVSAIPDDAELEALTLDGATGGEIEGRRRDRAGRNAEAVGEEGHDGGGLERRPVDRFRTAVAGTVGHGHRGRSGGVLGPHVVQPPAEHDERPELRGRRDAYGCSPAPLRSR